MKTGLGERIKNLKLNRAQVCEACGSEFTCEFTIRGCWCVDIKLSDETRALVKEKYNSCLCRQCLETCELEQQARTA
jgi:hypothetical protein